MRAQTLMKKNNWLLFCITFFCLIKVSEGKSEASRYEILSGNNISNTKEEWDQKFLSRGYIFGKAPAKFLKENANLLKNRSTVLDLGMGEGRNAVFLAAKGHKVVGIDISSVAVEKAKALAKEFNTEIKGVVASLDNYSINEASFDVIMCFYYVDRNLVQKMKKWLRPGGLIFYEAHTIDKLKSNPLINKNYLVGKGEIKKFFKEFELIKFEEPVDGSHRSSIIVKKIQ